MKKDVSCRAIQTILDRVESQKLPRETIFDGIPYTIEYLRNKRERIEWDAFCRIVTNLRAHWSDEEFESLGFEVIGSAPFRSFISLARLMYTAPEIYAYWTAHTRSPGKQLFDCITSTLEEKEKNHLVITLTLPPHYQYCREFFVITKGSFTAGTAVLGLDPARVSMHEIPQGAIYDVFCPEGGGAIPWLRRVIMRPIAARAAARELQEANEALHQRYAQLEEAQARIQLQARQLRTAFSISELIRSNLDLDATLDAVAYALVEEARFSAATVEISISEGPSAIHRRLTRGGATAGAQVLVRPLVARGRPLGQLSVWLDPNYAQYEAEELLNQVVPSVAMEINDALSFTLLSEYRTRDMFILQEFSRQQIESQERERKRLAGELHDGLGQDLLVASNQLQQFLEDHKGPNDDLRRVATLLQGSIDCVREISANLHPHHLDRLGFCAALEAMTERLDRTSGLVVERSCEVLDGVLPKETELHLYRIIQEALTNVVRHASATTVELIVKKNLGVIEVAISDNGKGFDLSERSVARAVGDPLHGFGLSSMNERARIAGGIVKIESSPGNGTVVRVMIPYQK